MRFLLQSALLRLATGMLWLASLLGRRSLERSETNALLSAAALQALEDAEERRVRRWPKTPPTAGSDEDATPPSTPDPPSDYVTMQAKAQLSPLLGNALLLVHEPSRVFLPIFVGATEAVAFRARLDGEPTTRPLTHDLFDSLLERIGAHVEAVRVDELRNNVFYARLELALADGQHIELDARPSDAIVLAMGNGAPIFVAHKVLNAAGRPFDDRPDGSEPSDT